MARNPFAAAAGVLSQESSNEPPWLSGVRLSREGEFADGAELPRSAPPGDSEAVVLERGLAKSMRLVRLGYYHG
jgi:hypothetical protein